MQRKPVAGAEEARPLAGNGVSAHRYRNTAAAEVFSVICDICFFSHRGTA